MIEARIPELRTEAMLALGIESVVSPQKAFSIVLYDSFLRLRGFAPFGGNRKNPWYVLLKCFCFWLCFEKH